MINHCEVKYVEDPEAFIRKRVTIGFRIDVPDYLGESVLEQAQIFCEAMNIYADRNEKYRDNWKRKGWRGALFGARLALERAWDLLWGPKPVPEHAAFDVDDLLDTMNYAAQAVRLIRAGDRDGSWRYPD